MNLKLTPEQKKKFLALSPEKQIKYVEKRLEYKDLCEKISIKEAARNNLSGFIRYINKSYQEKWFHLRLSNALTDFVHGKIKRLIIEMPPGRGKSYHVSVHAPAYAFGENPYAQIIATSYGADLSAKFNRQVQRLMDTPEYKYIYPDISLGGDNVKTIVNKPLKNSEEFEILYKEKDITGYYKNSGVGGSITGRRFSLGFIDDYVKGFEEADSPVYRERVWNWYKTDFYTRQLPNAGICITATRWHEEDLIGRLLQSAKEDKNADQWTVICFPEIIETEEDVSKDDPRTIGELLWEERYTMKDYLSIRAMYDTYQFNALYQQRPTAREGNAIKRTWYEPYAYVLPKLDSHVIYFDLGGSDNINADQTVGSALSISGTNEFLLWQHSGRWSPNDRNDQIESFSLRWNNIFPQIPIWIEAGIGLGAAGVQELRNRLLAKGLNVRLDQVNRSKYERATAQKDSFFAASEAKRIKLYAGEEFREQGFMNPIEKWINPFFNEVLRLQFKQTSTGIEFVGGHDDRLDSVVGGHNKITKNNDITTSPLIFF